MVKFLKQSNGTLTEEAAATDGGAGNAGKIPELDGNGRLKQLMMPNGIGPDTSAITASEALAAGDFGNIWNDGGTAKVRKADGGTPGKEAHCFVLEAVAQDAPAMVYFEGSNDQLAGLTPGPVFLSAVNPGQAVSAAPNAAGQIVQRLGIATSATEVNFERSQPIVLA